MMKKQNAENSQRAQGRCDCAADGMAYPFGAGTVKSHGDTPRRECNPPRLAALRRTVQHPLRVSI